MLFVPCLRRRLSTALRPSTLALTFPALAHAQGLPGASDGLDSVALARTVLSALLLVCVLWMLAYGLRQMLFALQRVWGRQRNPYMGVVQADWPELTVFVAAHNEEAVLAQNLRCLVASDYPVDKLHIVVVNDRSSDRTEAIADEWVARHPERIEAFHRRGGKAGKAAALKDAMVRARGDIALVFDADYTPSPGLLRQLAAPFLDPEVGAVMGRVVPRNTGANLLTRLLELERAAGYQVDQQARMNLRGVPQYGGTVGGVRLSALKAVGGWHDDVLAEDTDITFRLLVAGWKTVYCNHAQCHEEVPEEWPVRLRQVHRWARGHHQVMLRQSLALWHSPMVGWRERLDGLLLLGIFMNQPLLLLSWGLMLGLYYLQGFDLLGQWLSPHLLVLYAGIGSFSVFMHTVYAVLLDGHRERLRLLPLQSASFFASLPAMSRALPAALLDQWGQRELVWAKTRRYAREVTP
jgi:cellulose synthase/poly-beta-1,6-N-acetylglucosamine synthase-like glycosyltransferase